MLFKGRQSKSGAPPKGGAPLLLRLPQPIFLPFNFWKKNRRAPEGRAAIVLTLRQTLKPARVYQNKNQLKSFIHRQVYHFTKRSVKLYIIVSRAMYNVARGFEGLDIQIHS